MANLASKTSSFGRITAAVLAVQLDQLVRRELFREKCESFFWTDSTAVLQTLRNTSKRFPVFVADRLSKIENGSNVSQWRYVPTRLNPADSASRGIHSFSVPSSTDEG